jgi:uncharacterized protein (TIGR03000 family)
VGTSVPYVKTTPAPAGATYVRRDANDRPIAETASAHLTVKLPERARLYVDGVAAPLTASATRTFDTPQLQPGKDYSYTLKAELVRDGQTLTASKRVVFRTGESVTVDLNDLRSAASVASSR